MGPSSGIRVGNPFKGFAIDIAEGSRRSFRALLPRARRRPQTRPGPSRHSPASASPSQGMRFAKDDRGAFSQENLAPEQFTGDDRPENLGQQHGFRIEAGNDLQLGQRLVQPAQHTIELEEKDAQPLIFRLVANLRLQGGQPVFQSSGLNQFGGHS